MTVWVGWDGLLHDDEGDGPAIAGNPIEALAASLQGSDWSAEEEAFYVGQDGGVDLSSLGDLGSSLGQSGGSSGGLGSLLGDSGGGGLGSLLGSSGGGGAGANLGSLGTSLGSALGSAFGGESGGSTGGTIGDIFGSALQGAQSGGAQGMLGGLASSLVDKVVAPAIQSAAQPHPASAGSTKAPTTPTTPPPSISNARPSPPSGMLSKTGKRAPGGRKTHSMDPKARLLLVLGHMAKKYGMPPPAAPGPSSATRTGKW